MPIVGSSLRIFQLTLKASYAGANIVNTFDYRCPIISQPSAQLVAENFRDEVLVAIATTQLSNLAYTSLDVIDAMDDSNFYTLSLTENGDRTPVASLPAFICWSLQLLRSTRDMRSGWKRFCGLDEADIDGVGFSTAFQAFVNSARADIIQDLNIDLVVLPLVILRDRPTPSDPGVDPEDPTTWRYTTVAGSVFPNRVTSQNSRKTF